MIYDDDPDMLYENIDAELKVYFDMLPSYTVTMNGNVPTAGTFLTISP